MKQFDNIYEAIKYANLISGILEPFSFPNCDPAVEQQFTTHKTCKFPIDGYDVVMYCSKTSFANNVMHSLQLWCQDLPFLPMNVSVKIANIFYKTDNVCLFQLYNNGKFIYCWTKLQDDVGEILRPLDQFIEECTYKKFKYFLMTDKISF